MLLTSGGLANNKLISEFKSALDMPVKQARIAFIITASLAEPGDKAWLFKDLKKLYDLGVASVDIIDISQPKNEWIARVKNSDVIYVEGGNTKFLMYHAQKTGFADELPQLLKTRLYVGVSAGSMIVGSCLPSAAEEVIYDKEEFTEPYKNVKEYLNYLPIHIVPHYQAEYSKQRKDDVIKHFTNMTDKPIYALDDNSALLVKNANIQKVVTEGHWKVFLKEG